MNDVDLRQAEDARITHVVITLICLILLVLQTAISGFEDPISVGCHLIQAFWVGFGFCNVMRDECLIHNIREARRRDRS